MKKVFSLIFIFSILLSSFSSSIIYLHYLSNKNYYANVLCENKTKPAMHCNGQCCLKKQLDKQEKKEQGVPVGNIKDKTEIVYFNQAPHLNIFSTLQTATAYFHFAELSTIDYPTSVFHPPSC